MAVQIVNSGNNLHRTTNIVGGGTNYTCIFWANLTNYLAAYNLFVTANGTPGTAGYTKFAEIYGILGANGYNLDVNDGTTDGSVAGGTVATNLWVPIAYTRSGHGHTLYINGAALPFTTIDLSAAGLNFILLGDDGTNDGGTQQFYNFREWNVALNNIQINQEINSPSAVVNSSGLQTFTPLTSDLLDISGNGNNWTQTGSVSFVSNPTFPANLSTATAIVIPSLPTPYSNSQNVLIGGSNFAASVWYKYTA